MKRNWIDVPGELLTEVNLVLPFVSAGFYDPGSMYGGSDQLGYPPEGGDERLPDGLALLDFGKDAQVELTTEQTDQLVELLRDELYQADIETEDDR